VKRIADDSHDKFPLAERSLTMSETRWLHRSLERVQPVVRGAMAVCLLFGATAAFAQDAESNRLPLRLHQERGDTLLVWAGDKAHEAPDFLAVVNFDRDSPRYGKILRIVPLPAGALGAGAVGNEPHLAASPATDERWRSVACSAFCGARIRSSSLM
jgi:hypothetical protein